jgi:hypothetical protein
VAEEPLFECTFLIPLRRDPHRCDGRRHLKKAWLWLDRELYVFSGVTRAREPLEGWYVDPDTGKRVADSSRKFYLALAQEDLPLLRSVLRKACGVFQQKCIYLSISGRVEFVKGDDDEARDESQ